MKRNLLTITYKNGRTLKQLVNYLHMEDGAIYYTEDAQIQNVIERPARIPLANIESFNLEAIECNGWAIPEQAGTWYAVQKDCEDDWGTGSFDLSEAFDIADRLECDIIAMIEGDVCVKELHRGEDF